MIYPLTIVREDFVLILIIIFIIYPNEYKEIYSISNTYYYKRYTTIRIINTLLKERRLDFSYFSLELVSNGKSLNI